MNSTLKISTLLSLALLASSAHAETKYVVIDVTGTGKGANATVIGGGVTGDIDPAGDAYDRAVANAATKLKNQCAKDYKGILATTLCVTDHNQDMVPESGTTASGDIWGSNTYHSKIRARAFCTVDPAKLNFFQQRGLGTTFGDGKDLGKSCQGDSIVAMPQ